MHDLFGHDSPGGARARRSRPRAGAATPAARPTLARPELVEDRRVDLPSSAVESFVGLGASVCLLCATVGAIWLVPDYTGEARPEISAADLVRLLATLQVFPGAQVASFTSMGVNALPSTSSAASTRTRSS